MGKESGMRRFIIRAKGKRSFCDIYMRGRGLHFRENVHKFMDGAKDEIKMIPNAGGYL